MKHTRRRFLQTMGIQSLALSLNRSIVAAMPDQEGSLEFLRNDALANLKPDFKGNPLRNGKFLNQDMETSLKSFGTVFKWFLSKNPQRTEKINDPFRLAVRPVENFKSIEKDCIIWLGHAAFLIRVEGKWILTDPCLTAPPLQKRFSELPMRIAELGDVDYVIQSHNHFDHLDSDTFAEWSSSHMTVLAPLRLGETIRSLNKHVTVQEAGWYQTYALNEKFKIHFLPAHHWSTRGIWDRNTSLWGSFMIETKGRCIYFAGDTNYAPHFAAIAELFPSIDIALMPIGAYKPEHIMKSNHTNPEEAVRAFHDLGARTLIPMHYGTFDLADEPRGEPLRWLKKIEAEGRIRGTLKTPDVGEIVPF